MFLYIQQADMSGEEAENEPAKKRQLTTEKRSKGLYVRLTESEQEQLKKVSQQSGISVSQLLRTGALGQLDRLPAFQKLPAEVVAQLTKLDRLTTALWYISQRVDADTVYAQDIREVVYEVGAISHQVNQFCQQNMVRYSALALLDRLIQELHQTDAPPVSCVLGPLQALRDSYQTISRP
jgi:small-conductance mechanosensitive channel